MCRQRFEEAKRCGFVQKVRQVGLSETHDASLSFTTRFCDEPRDRFVASERKCVCATAYVARIPSNSALFTALFRNRSTILTLRLIQPSSHGEQGRARQLEGINRGATRHTVKWDRLRHNGHIHKYRATSSGRLRVAEPPTRRSMLRRPQTTTGIGARRRPQVLRGEDQCNADSFVDAVGPAAGFVHQNSPKKK